MNTHRAVRQFLAKEEKKTELKSERVELALADDIAKALKASEDILDGSERSVNFAEKVAKNRNALLKDLPKLLKESNSVFSFMEQWSLDTADDSKFLEDTITLGFRNNPNQFRAPYKK